MTFSIASGVAEITYSSGTGALTLDGKYDGISRTFSQGYADLDTFYCRVENVSVDNEWEDFEGRYNATGNTVTRIAVLGNSTNTLTPLDFSKGKKIIFVSVPGSTLVVRHPDGTTPLASSNLSAGPRITIDDDQAIDVKDEFQRLKLLGEEDEINSRAFEDAKTFKGKKSFHADTDGDLYLTLLYGGDDGKVMKTLHRDGGLIKKQCIWYSTDTDDSPTVDATNVVPSVDSDSIPVDSTTDKYTSVGKAPSGDPIGLDPATCTLIGVKVYTYDTDGVLLSFE